MNKILTTPDIDSNDELIGRKIKVLVSNIKEIGSIYTCHELDLWGNRVIVQEGKNTVSSTYRQEKWELLDE